MKNLKKYVCDLEQAKRMKNTCEKLIKISDLKEGDKVKATTSWGFPVQAGEIEIIGNVIFNKKHMCYELDGIVVSNGRNLEKCFPLNECWDFKKFEDKNETSSD